MSSVLSKNILGLSYRELQEELGRVGLSKGGSTQALRQRLRGWYDNQVQNEDNMPNKRQKTFDADDLICPISLFLPWDPVTAEDGRVYERWAIEAHIKSHGTIIYGLTSPMTNECMGNRLLPAVQQKNLIQALIESGVITGALADKWNETAKEKKDMEGLLKKGEGGDLRAMHKAAANYSMGRYGFEQDQELAYNWYKKAHDAGHKEGTGAVGYRLCEGCGVNKCEKRGLMYLAMAAGQGSAKAAYRLGRALAYGKYGVPVDKADAIRWLHRAYLGGLDEAREDRAIQTLTELIIPAPAPPTAAPPAA